VSSQGTYGPLDPWAYKLTHSTGPTLITEHSAGQDPDRRPIVLVADPATVVRASGFHWGDAGIGAAAALVAGFVLIAAARFRRRPFAGVSV
jgi:hypothetical protein